MMIWGTLVLSTFLQSPPSDPKWTEEEVGRRIREIFTTEQQKDVEVFRSKYYIVFTDSAAGKSFAKILDEQVYEGFRKLFPFDDQEDQRLMAVYLFKTAEGYFDFCERVAKWSRKQAEQSAGHAWKDYYATSYTSPRDSIHFHEGAHQIMSNRLRLGGGGGGRYGQAASVIQFLKEGPLKDRFPEFFKKVGRAPRGKIETTEKIVREVYGLSIEELEARWKERFLK